MRLNTKQIVEITGGDLVVAPLDDKGIITGLSWDSRQMQPRWAYAALPGERVDGHDFVAAAIRGGAVLALVSRRPDGDVRTYAAEMGCAIVEVSDVAAAITDLARAWRRMLHCKVIGITGSVGKTTTKSLVRSVLSAKYRTYATKGNFNNELGAPYTVLCAEPDCEMLVLEMGMSSLGEIAHICEFAAPDMGLITNVGTSHIEYLGTRENIARAKAELIEALPDATGKAFLPAACEFNDFICTEAATEQRHVDVSVYGGSSPSSDAYATDVVLDEQGRPRFVLHAAGRSVPCELSLRGVHNVDNACGAASIGLACGIALEEIASALQSTEPEAGRQEFKRARGGFTVIDDTYNASPDSMEAGLRTLCSCGFQGRRVAVLGDMGELGDSAAACHRAVGRFAAGLEGLDALVCVGELSREMADAAREAGMDPDRVHWVDGVPGAISVLDGLLDAGDAVLVKASHYMGLDRVVGGIIN